VVLKAEFIEHIRSGMSKLPNDYRAMLAEIGLDSAVIEDIIAVPETAHQVGRVYEAADASHAKRVAFWLMQPQSDDAEKAAEAVQSATDEQLIALSQMVADNKLSSTAAKEVLIELFKTGESPEKIAEKKNLLQVSDEGAIAQIVAQVIADNPKAAEDVKAGEMKAIGFLTGQVMKLSQGKANPALAQQLIKKHLGV